MKEAYFEFQFPRDNLYLSIFSHKIMNYRYHWHPTDYELNILLNMDKKENEIVGGEPDEGEAVGGRKEKSYER